jgi:hypothetical protein
MTTLWQNGKTVARRLRVRGSKLDPISTQLRIASLLNVADLHPVGLAPSAILCIRTLRDPLPGSLQVRQCSGNMRPPRAWEQAVIASLDQSVRQAARPAHGSVPATAEAVIFTDRAELLACLAIDCCEGSVSTNWWWQSLFKGVDIARTVLPAWIDAPEYIPAALQHLAARGKAVPFARSLSANDTRTLLQSIVRSFALHELAGTPFVGAQPLSGNTTGRHSSAGASLADNQPGWLCGGLQKMPPRAAPWQPWVPESKDASLQLEQQGLLGIGLMLHRAPTVVRTTSFAHAAIQWYLAAQLPATSRETSENEWNVPTVPLTGQVQGPEPKTAIQTFTLDEEGTHQVRPPGQPHKDDLHLSDEQDTRKQHLHRDNPHISKVKSIPKEYFYRNDVLSDEQHDHKDGLHPKGVLQGTRKDALHLSNKQSSHKRDAREYLYEAQIETAFGGVFYLINLGLFLNLYGDFTTPLQPGIPLPLWDFVALLGRQLLGEKIQTNPVWILLAQLAGRSEQEAPGQHFEPLESWHLPVEWLTPFPEAGVWQWSAGGGRLRVKHPEQFLVLDLPLDKGDPVQQLRQEMQAYGDVQLIGRGQIDRAPTSRHGKMRPQLKRWLGWLMPYVRAYLKRALTLSDVDELPHILCEHSARILATATHLDIILSLDELPIEIRMAGLDRDPGWVPAAGRFIAFHFEVPEAR